MRNERAYGGYILPLREVSRHDVGHAGVKAAHLGELSRAGFPVPEGFVVTTAGFERFLAGNTFPADTAPAQVASGALPADLAQALATAAADLGDLPLAVRSSGVAEDLSGASFAGLYVTVLDVRGADALADAVRRCWASVFSERVAAYRAARGHLGAAGMAVLVQRLVRADAAGVAFTANPVTGDRTETVVSAVRGLGERLVSGQASPDEWLVKGDEATCQRAPEDAIDAPRARAIADLARRVERHFGTPQDIEWALADGRLFLLQARPITGLSEEAPIPVPVEPPPGFWQREASHYPRPVSPMFRTLLAAFNLSLRSMMSEFSLLADAVEFREIGGWVYRRLVPLGGRDRPAPPAWLMPLLLRVVPPIRARVRGALEAVRSDKVGVFIQRWDAEWKPDLMASLARLREVHLASVSDEDLDRHIAAVIAFFQRSLSIHTRVNGAVLVSLAEIAFACRDLLGWDDRRTFDLLSGLSERSSEPSRRLAELAQMARDRPAARQLLERIDHHTVERLADTDRVFAEAFAAYQQEFGCRALGEVADSTLAERPTLVLGLIRDQLVRGYDPAFDTAALEGKRTAAVAEARAGLAGRTAGDRGRFERALARAERAYPLREDNQFYAVSAPMALPSPLVGSHERILLEDGGIAYDDRTRRLRGARRRRTNSPGWSSARAPTVGRGGRHRVDASAPKGLGDHRHPPALGHRPLQDGLRDLASGRFLVAARLH